MRASQFHQKSFTELVKKFEFTEDSKLKTNEEKALYKSSLESITIPREVTRIKKKLFLNVNYDELNLRIK